MNRKILNQMSGVNSLRHTLQKIEKQSGLRQLAIHADKHRAMLRSIEGPLADLKRSGVFDQSSALNQEIQRAKDMFARIEAQYRLPEISEQVRLFSEFKVSPAFEALKKSQNSMASIQHAMELMRSPWLDAQNAMKSLSGFAQLQGIGSVLKNVPSFEDIAAETLRFGLGDWRDPIMWPKEIFTNYEARSSFYEDRGFRPELTDFPSEAFEESLKIADLTGTPPVLVEQYGEPVPHSDDEEEEDGFYRTNMAHDWLFRLESQMRWFIDTLLTKQYGSDWPKHRLPGDLYDQWQTKKERSQKAGRPSSPLIAYADFTDYELIICRRDNWKEVFSNFFVRPENVRETFQRLHPLRIDTMHARLITQDDELFLFVEVKRIMKVIGELR